MIDYQKPPLKERDLKLYESFNKQFLSSFPDKPAGIALSSWVTCDMHLNLKQPLKFVDPKGNPVDEITWDEPIDKALYWQEHMKLVWFGVFVSSCFFFVMIYYFWGK